MVHLEPRARAGHLLLLGAALPIQSHGSAANRARLRHDAFDRVDQQERAVDHAERVAAEAVFTALRQELKTLDPSLALASTNTHEEHRQQSLLVQRLQTETLTIFGTAGLFLSLLGVFAVMSYTVSQQVHEIGIRMAIGARQSDVLRWVLRRGLILNLSGLTVGLVGSFWAVQLLRRTIEGATTLDPWVVAGAALLLLITTMAAAWLPARRASRLDPLIALRQE